VLFKFHCNLLKLDSIPSLDFVFTIQSLEMAKDFMQQEIILSRQKTFNEQKQIIAKLTERINSLEMR